ncbi:MAG: addiction module toxin RelE, partial [Methylococcales bacterium]|nr:addiction module toxin RelE [Methylococcales bacterium]
IPKKQKQAPAKPLSFFAEQYKTRDECMTQAYLSGHYTLAQVGEYFGVSYATVSRAVKQAEKRVDNVKGKA